MRENCSQLLVWISQYLLSGQGNESCFHNPLESNAEHHNSGAVLYRFKPVFLCSSQLPEQDRVLATVRRRHSRARRIQGQILETVARIGTHVRLPASKQGFQTLARSEALDGLRPNFSGYLSCCSSLLGMQRFFASRFPDHGYVCLSSPGARSRSWTEQQLRNKEELAGADAGTDAVGEHIYGRLRKACTELKAMSQYCTLPVRNGFTHS